MHKNDFPSRSEVREDLSALFAINFGNYNSVKQINNESLHSAWYAFQSNIESVRLMAGLPQTIVNAAISHLLPLVQATYNVLGKPVMEDSELLPNKIAIRKEYAKIAEGFMDDRKMVRLTFGTDLASYNNRELTNSPLTRPGFVALMEAIVIGAWTAFDALTTDLFVAAVNVRPQILRPFDKRQITIGDLLDGSSDLNWNGRFGELLRLFVRLDSYREKKEAYERAFKCDRIRNAIDSKKANAANLVRNLLIHDSGIVTDDFIRQVSKSEEPSVWKVAQVGCRLPLHGHSVAGLAEDLVECANELVMALDEWLGVPAKQGPKSPDPSR